jgi:hypothetical protein
MPGDRHSQEREEGAVLGDHQVPEQQMATRRDRAKLGFACARDEVSKKAQLEILRSSQTDVLLVPIGAEQTLLDDAERLDERLAEMVIAATVA